MIADGRLALARGLILRIAPELSAAPLYLTTAPADYPPACGVGAFHCRVADAAIRQSLIDACRWQGPGNLIVICRDDLDADDLDGVALHEAAHALPFCPFDFEDHEPTDAERSREAAAVAAWAAAPEATKSATPPWHPHHGLQFVRRCLHLHHRAERAGVALPLPALRFAGAPYGLAGAWRYRRAIGDECERLAALTFGQIEAITPPPAFQSLFDSDVEAWHKTKESKYV